MTFPVGFFRRLYATHGFRLNKDVGRLGDNCHEEGRFFSAVDEADAAAVGVTDEDKLPPRNYLGKDFRQFV